MCHPQIIVTIVISLYILSLFPMNAYKWYRTSKIHKVYEKFVLSKPEATTWDFHTYKRELIELFKNAGVKNPYKIQEKQLPSGYVHHAEVDFFESMTALDVDVVSFMRHALAETLGFYKRKTFESLNPILWLDFIIFLPQKIIVYLGFSDAKYYKFISKLLNTIYWILSFLYLYAKLYIVLGHIS